MGWRYRRRIKLLPGIYLNISKSGISTNVGVKGANVTFGKKGTYVNTGIPGTGLYRRDKVAGCNAKDVYLEENPTETYSLKESSNQETFHTTKEYDETTCFLSYNPLHYVFYFVSLICFIVTIVWCFNGLSILYSCLANACFQLILSLAIISNMSINGINKAYSVRSIEDSTISLIHGEVNGHRVRCILSIVMSFFNLSLFLIVGSTFIRQPNGHLSYYFSGSIWTFLFSVIASVCWMVVYVKEKNMLKSLQSIVRLIVGRDYKKTDDSSFDTAIESNNNIKSTSSEKCELVDKDRQATSKANVSVDNFSKSKSANASRLQDDLSKPFDPKAELENYRFPTLDLLNNYESDEKPFVDTKTDLANKNRIVHILYSFGIEIISITSNVGPRITFYEITLTDGVSISKVRGLDDDIALGLGALSARIIAPIPGRGTIGIEVPNKITSVVSMKKILESKTYQESNFELPCALGLTMTNELFMFDLTKAPNVLIAGSTGQGKSVAINVIITSLLYKKHPTEVKFVLMDPNAVELELYNTISNHFLASLSGESAIVTNGNQAVSTLNALCEEIENRYSLMKKAQVRNIKDYNRKFIARQLNTALGHSYMPYLVVIIDEYANFFYERGQEIEDSMVRIAHNARAVGIHMIIATQRPTTNIITGTIKSNFPTRIAFKVSSMMDSRIIIDRPDAYQLIGRGDMLYVQSGEPVRVQCAFVDTSEVLRICNFISEQQSFPEKTYLPESRIYDDEGGCKDVDLNHLDPMFADVAKMVVLHNAGSTSLIQRKFFIGYNRAGRLMDQLEAAGIVGPEVGSKPREVLITDMITLDRVLNALGAN